jgi:hypothetical protein
MKIKFAVVVLISLMYLSAQVQSMEAENPIKDESIEERSKEITTETTSEIISKNSEEQRLAQNVKVCFRINVLCYFMPVYFLQ